MMTNDELPTNTPEGPRATEGWSARRKAILIIAGVVVLLLAAAGVVVVPRLLGPDNQIAQPGGPPATLPTDPAPDGWRTEQFREITFEVPADWGYAYEPGPAWCVGDPKNPRPEHLKPYVALGEPDAVPAIACPELPDALITEHVAATQPADLKADVRAKLGNGFWEVTKTIGAVKLRAVSKDADLAQKIVDTGALAGDDALCRPDHPLAKDLAVRPTPAYAVTDYGSVERIALCQYSGGLRAAGELTGDEAQRLIDGIAAAPVNSATCEQETDGVEWINVAAVLRVQTTDTVRELILRQSGCPEGDDKVIGGFDDGTQVRAATPETCRAVLTKPLGIQAGSGSVFKQCVG